MPLACCDWMGTPRAWIGLYRRSYPWVSSRLFTRRRRIDKEGSVRSHQHRELQQQHIGCAGRGIDVRSVRSSCERAPYWTGERYECKQYDIV